MRDELIEITANIRLNAYEEGHDNGYFIGGIIGILSTILFAGVAYIIWNVIL